MLTYIQSTGNLLLDGQLIGTGWSGHDAGRNNPSMENAPDIGPIPCGTWALSEPYQSIKLGPVVFVLTPILGTDTFGRSLFRIHGASVLDPGESSHGCIILTRGVRDRIAAASTERVLEVRAQPS